MTHPSMLLDPYLAPYQDSDYVRAFVRHRHLAPACREMYVNDLLAGLSEVTRRQTIRFLDVGAGTGQFTAEFARQAEQQGLSVDITALEPSPVFRRYLEHTTTLSGFWHIVEEPLEDFEPDISFHVILLSEVAHLFHDHRQVFTRLRDITAPGGTVGLRYGSRQQVQERNWYRFFPATGSVDLARAPFSEEYENLLTARGFQCVTAEIDESANLDTRTRLEIVADKAYSSFRLVEEDVFEEGLRDLAAALAAGEIDLHWVNKLTWTKAHLPPAS